MGNYTRSPHRAQRLVLAASDGGDSIQVLGFVSPSTISTIFVSLALALHARVFHFDDRARGAQSFWATIGIFVRPLQM